MSIILVLLFLIILFLGVLYYYIVYTTNKNIQVLNSIISQIPSSILNKIAPNSPIDCTLSAWTDWGACDKSCGGGTQVKTRTKVQAQFGGKDCSSTEKLSEEKVCNTESCPVAFKPVDCVLSEWSPWKPCNKTCGGGIQVKNRTKTQAQHGGASCVDTILLQEEEKCNTQVCDTVVTPVDCTYTDWNPWSSCTKTCGGGTKSKNRTKKTVAKNGGKECVGSLQEEETCNTQECLTSLKTAGKPVDCTYDSWSTWSPCTKTCGGGL